MNSPLWRYVAGFIALVVAVVVILWATSAGAEEPCLQTADRCWTASDYDEAYADPFAEFDIMEYFGVPEASAVHSFAPEPQKRPSERRLGAGLVETLFTFSELLSVPVGPHGF